MVYPTLFTSLTLGGKKDPIQLRHRVVMAPLTRLRTGDDGIPSEMVATYYSQRATPGGLLIAEATNISATARGYFGSPGIFSSSQIKGWQAVTQAVHAKDGKIFLQLWHTGRVGHADNLPNGQLPVSATATRPLEIETKKAVTKNGRVLIGEYRALAASEVPGVCQEYQDAAVNALAAGFDGVELHAANGYLLGQFLHDGVNDRTDEYGGALENRARFLFEALDAIVAKVDASKVAIRLSPYDTSYGQGDADPVATYSYVLARLNAYNLAYVHLIEPRSYHAVHPMAPATGVAHAFRGIYDGVLMTASGYDRQSAIAVIDDGDADLVAFGRHFIANPDLVRRLERGAALTPWRMETFYVGGTHGYTDYPFVFEATEREEAGTVSSENY